MTLRFKSSEVVPSVCGKCYQMFGLRSKFMSEYSASKQPTLGRDSSGYFTSNNSLACSFSTSVAWKEKHLLEKLGNKNGPTKKTLRKLIFFFVWFKKRLEKCNISNICLFFSFGMKMELEFLDEAFRIWVKF